MPFKSCFLKALVFSLLMLCPDLFGQSRLGAPFIVNSALDSAEKIFVCETEKPSLADIVSGIPGLGEKVVVRVGGNFNGGKIVTRTSDPWIQDAIVFGYAGGRAAVLEMPGEQGFKDWVRKYFTREAAAKLFFSPVKPKAGSGGESRFDCGGNIMASPPVPGFPYGRLMVGQDMTPALKKYFASQKVQCDKGRLIEIDTRPLHVGHVDEIIGFIPSATPPGFKLIVADPEAGLRLLDKVPPDQPIFCDPGGVWHMGVVTDAGARFLEDSTFRFAPKKWMYVRIISGLGAGQTARVYQTQERRLIIDKVFDFRPMGGLSVTGVVHFGVLGRVETMPIWFDVPDRTSRYLVVESSKEWLDGESEPFPAVLLAGELARDDLLRQANQKSAELCRKAEAVVRKALGGVSDSAVIHLPVLFTALADGQDAFTLIPNLVNLQVFNREIILPATFFGKKTKDDVNGDPFEAEAVRLLSDPFIRLHFIDAWNSVHRRYGGVHCGTNVRRKSAAGK